MAPDIREKRTIVCAFVQRATTVGLSKVHVLKVELVMPMVFTPTMIQTMARATRRHRLSNG